MGRGKPQGATGAMLLGPHDETREFKVAVFVNSGLENTSSVASGGLALEPGFFSF